VAAWESRAFNPRELRVLHGLGGGRWTRGGEAESAGELAADVFPGLVALFVREHPASPQVTRFAAQAAAAAPRLVGGGAESFTGRVAVGKRVGGSKHNLATLDWHSDLHLRDDVAARMSHDDPAAAEVMLHEMIHGVGVQAADADAYQDKQAADVEEGFTELGATLHAGEFFRQAGIDGPATPKAWGHYPAQTSAALAWARQVAAQRGVTVQQVADEMNRMGAAGKADAVARSGVPWPGEARRSGQPDTPEAILAWAWADPRRRAAQAFARLDALPAAPAVSDAAAMLTRLAAALPAREGVSRKFNPSEPRDPHGRWTAELGRLSAELHQHEMQDDLAGILTGGHKVIHGKVAAHLAKAQDALDNRQPHRARHHLDVAARLLAGHQTRTRAGHYGPAPRLGVAALLSRAAVSGHHVPGTPYHYRHGWIPVAPYFKTPGDLSPGDVVEFRGHKHMVTATPSQIAKSPWLGGWTTSAGRPNRETGVFLKPLGAGSRFMPSSQVATYSNVTGEPAPGRPLGAALASQAAREREAGNLPGVSTALGNMAARPLRPRPGSGWKTGDLVNVRGEKGTHRVRHVRGGLVTLDDGSVHVPRYLDPAGTPSGPQFRAAAGKRADAVGWGVTGGVPMTGDEILSAQPPRPGESPSVYESRLMGMRQSAFRKPAGQRPSPLASWRPDPGGWAQDQLGNLKHVIAVKGNKIKVEPPARNGAAWMRAEDLRPYVPVAEEHAKLTQLGQARDLSGPDMLDQWYAHNVHAPITSLRPAGNPAKVTVVGHALSPDQVALQAHLDTGIRSASWLGGGAQADTQLLELGDGTEAVKKDFNQGWGDDMGSAEYLAGQVGAAVQAGGPAVVHDPDNPQGVLMQFMDGELAEDASQTELSRAQNSPRGYRVGLLDYLTQNDDRHPMNYLISPSGDPVPIDNSSTFGYEGGGWDSPFWSAYQDQMRAGKYPLSLADLKAVGKRMTAIKDEFHDAGHDDWYKEAMARLRRVEQATQNKTGRTWGSL